jgi:SpoVK/Ycf46/Vps4 family AAA+-type ATPase
VTSEEAEYLQAQEKRIKLRLARAVALEEREPLEPIDVELASASQRVAALQRPEFGVEALRARFSLSDEEVDILLHAAFASLDSSFDHAHARLGATGFPTGLSVAMALRVSRHGLGALLQGWIVFDEKSALLGNRLLVLERSTRNLLESQIKLPRRVTRRLLGVDPSGGISLGRVSTPTMALDEVVLPDEVRRDLEPLIKAQPHLMKSLAEWGYDDLRLLGRSVVLLVSGPAGVGKTMLAEAVASALGKKLFTVDALRLSEAGRMFDSEVEELFLEARQEDAVVLFDGADTLFSNRAPGSELAALLAGLDHFPGVVILTTRSPDRLDAMLDRRILLQIPLEVPPPQGRAQIWRGRLPPKERLADNVDAQALGKRFEFAGGTIRAAILLGVNRALARGADAKLMMEDLESAASAQMRGDLSRYAERSRARLSIDLLILPPEEKAQIAEIIHAGRNRARVLYQWGFSEKLPTGKGLVGLLSGDPGTGKTLAAEIIAAELGLSLQRINPAKIVSKYVGETEKNLNEVLAQAKSSQSVLFFDEADALFASRVSKVESSNDRYANLETNFLLQQLERHEGIVLLATNLETSIDQAFKRRIAYHITLPFPKPEYREQIWRTLLPERAPQAQIDFAKLGRHFELSGGHIKNAVLRAAYFAAERNCPIDDTLLAEAAEREADAAGKLVFRR